MQEIAKDVYLIPLFPRHMVNAYLIGDVLIDAGIRSSGKRILKELNGKKLSAHAITHAHADHQGASAFICKTLGIPYWCGPGDKEMAESGDLFLLDMGTPVKIIDLAERLIRLSGKSVKRDTNNETVGEIEIKITGLRPGEKLYEELLVDADAQPTAHAKIMRAREQYVTLQALEAGMQDLICHLNQSNTAQFKLTLAKLVVGYKPSEPTQSV